MNDHNRDSLASQMAVLMGREVADGDVIHCGAFTPLVLASGMWAMAHHAPNAVILPVSLAGVRIFKPFPISYSLLEAMTLANGVQYTMTDIFTHVEGPEGCAYEPINPLQIDRWGNVNMSVIGDFRRPDLRGPGAAGVDILPIMVNHRLLIYCPRHSPRIFVENVDFVTGVGNSAERRNANGVRTGGIRKVITNLAVLEFDDTGRMMLTATHPGVSAEDVQRETGFELAVADHLDQTESPSEEELGVLEQIDPLGIRSFEFMSAAERRARMLDLWASEYTSFTQLARQLA